MKAYVKRSVDKQNEKRKGVPRIPVVFLNNENEQRIASEAFKYFPTKKEAVLAGLELIAKKMN
jgi:hypothetical protein